MKDSVAARIFWGQFGANTEVSAGTYIHRMIEDYHKKLNTIDEHGNVIQKGEGQCDTSQS